ncbi:serine-rich adhesin for platelets isoform X12 [Drosophila pseudoobscura]|uniref:Serine-rich adhesin for platelets isoform X12 n=1 Tax=Drosophila pseudoobscura pseudoobscura TaxID=46245 RepID=A0A6I8VTC6_DROPS|nr:serine-rich adhesin for platelets isoform X12 [Drosophila pseudoobscura]
MAGESPASNSSESSPVQRQLNGSVDSGIAVLEVLEMETPTLRRRQRLQQCQRILQVLQRDHSTHRLLRDRLSKIADRKWKKEEAREQQSCNVCCADLDQSSPKTYVTCCTCGKYVCRGPKCADWRPKDADWECQLCHSSKESLAHTSSWVAEQMSFNQHKFVYPMRARSEVYIPITGDGDGDANDSTMHIESISQIGQSAHLEERAKIRAYVEEIVAEMLGGSLDHIKVGQLSKSENYLQFFHKFHAKLSNLLINVESDLLKGDLPAIVNGSNSNSNNNNNNNGDSESLADISQTRLRSLIETIIAETLRNSALSVSGAVSEISLDTRSLAAELPNNGNGLKRRHRTEHYFEPKIYQDLLATAVLNKIADKEGNTRLISESTPDLSGHLIDENYNAEALSTTSGSSIEPRSDCSLTDHELALDTGKSKSLQADLERESVLSDYIAAHMVPLPDFSASVTESEDDVGSISSSMIGDGTWEDNWLFKKKRSSVQSSVTPSSIGMLVPAPMENVRAQIGDRTADEVSDLSELGSDVEDNSLDLLRCNDLNDRLLSKHLIGGQNTKLVLDELVDRTSLISHTLPEEHEPAFTETTNTFVVASSAAPSDIIVSLPSPMVFQDDSMNEELVQTPIAAQGETDELASLEGCIGYSTVEYIDEEQMRETTPSVIEILAAIALGPMLAVPASEQPGVITPSEMHTLKELSDLALAEINARTMDLAHHSLDIIEEENIELMPFTGSVSQPSTINVHPSTLTDPTTNHQSTETTAAQEPKVVPKPAIDSDAPIHNPSTTKILTVDKPAALDPPAAVEISPETDTVAVDPPSPAAAEIIPDAETVAAYPPAPVEIIPETETVAVDPAPPAAVEITPAAETVAVDPPAAALEIIPDAETVAVDPPAPVEIIPGTEMVAVYPAPPAAVEITPAAETVAVDPPAVVEIITEPETVAVDPPAAALEIIPDAETVAVDPPAPVEIIPETETVAVYPAPPVAVEITPAAETVALDPPAVVEIITEPETVAVDPTAAALEIIPDAETVAVDPSAAAEIIPDAETVAVDPPAPVEIIPETETVAVDPAPPDAVVITPAAETVAVDPPAAALEITPAAETVVVYPPAAALEIIPDAETVAVDPPAPVEIIPETETVAVDPAPPAAVEITPAAETVAVDPPAAALEIIPDAETVAVDPPAPVEIIPETETVAVDPALPAAVEITPAAETVALDPPAVVEIITEPETVAVDPTAAALEIIPDAETVAVDPSAAAEIIPETEYVAVDPAPPAALEITPAAETVAVDPSAAAEIIPETETVAVDPSAPVEIIPETEYVAVDHAPPAALEITPAAETVAVDPSAAAEIIPETETVAVDPSAPVETETVAVDPVPPAAVEITPAAETVAVDPPAAALEIIPDAATVAVDPPAPVEIIPETETVAVDPASSAAVEITPAAETVAVDPPAVVEIITEPETVVADPPAAALEITLAAETVAVDPPAAALEIIPDAATVAVDPPAPVEIIPETETVAVDPAPPAAVEITPAAETVAVDSPVAVEIISETEIVAVDLPAAGEISPKTDTVAVDRPPPAATEIISEAETVAVDPSVPVEIFPGTEMVAVDPAPPAAVEITPAAETVAVNPPAAVEDVETVSVDPPEAVEIITVTENVAVDPPAALEITPAAETVAVDPPAVVEIIPETETVAVDPAPPAAVEITPAAETVAVDPPAAALEIIPNAETVAVDPPAPVEIIPETETVAVDPAPPAAVEITPAAETVAVDPPAAALEIIPNAETVAVDPPAPVEIIPETETVAVDPALPAAVEITPAAETVAVDPPAVVEIITEPETVVADPPAAALEIIPDAATVAVDPPAPVEIIPETEMVAVDHAPPAALEITPAAETVAVDPSAAAEIIPETETVAVDPSPPAVVEIIAGTESVVLDPTGAVEFIPETQTKAVEIPAVEVEAKSVSDLGPNALIDDTQLLSCVPKPLKESDNMDTSLLEPSSECVPAQTSVEYTKSDSSALGSIAEREVKKWYNAVEMPNNPYAPEALKQRISGTQERYMDVPNISPSAEQKALAAALTEDGDPAPPSTDYKRYSRDYYINNAPNGTEVNGIVRRASSGAEKQPSAEDVEQDIVITEAAQNASTTAIEQDKEQESVAANVYTALPAQVFDDLLETQSNPSLHSLQTTTTTSDESETVRVYDFNKQETTVIRPAPAEQQPSSSTTSSMESAQSASVSSSSIDASVSKKRERPVVLQFGPADSVPTIGSPVNTPTRGSTPPAFRFLQPKRRLIEPSQVLSVDEDDVMEPNTPVAEKPAVEDEVVHAMPSVKALAQAFLLTSKAQQAERRWRSKVRLSLPADTSDKSPTSLARRHKLEHAVSMAEVADESTIASDLSSLETDPSIQSDGSTNPPIASPVTPVPVRHGFLRSNIAFFENLKFK